MRLISACLVGIATLLGLLSGCRSDKGNNMAKEPRIVHVPHRVWPGSRSAPEMDAVFRELRPGQELQLKVIFADPKNSLVTPEDLTIRRGSIYLYSKTGYFRLDSNGKVYSSPDGQQEMDLESTVMTPAGTREPCQEIEMYYRTIWNTKSSRMPLDVRFNGQPICFEEGQGQYIGYILVRLSDDFDGDVIGWRSCHGI